MYWPFNGSIQPFYVLAIQWFDSTIEWPLRMIFFMVYRTLSCGYSFRKVRGKEPAPLLGSDSLQLF